MVRQNYGRSREKLPENYNCILLRLAIQLVIITRQVICHLRRQFESVVVEEEKEALILATTLGHACMLLLRAHSGKWKIVVLLQPVPAACVVIYVVDMVEQP